MFQRTEEDVDKRLSKLKSIIEDNINSAKTNVNPDKMLSYLKTAKEAQEIYMNEIELVEKTGI